MSYDTGLHPSNDPSTKFTLKDGTPVRTFEQVGSTNETTERLWIEEKMKSGIITSKVQLQGKGRLGRRWESGRGGLYFSEILVPPAGEEHMRRLPLIGLAAAVSVAKCLDSFLPSDHSSDPG